MPDTQIPVQGGTLPQGFCPTTPQEMLNGFVAVMTVGLPSVNSSVKVSTSVTVDDIGKLWIKVDGSGNPLGSFVYDAAVGDWVRSVPYTNTVPVGTIWDWYFVGVEAAAKAAALLLGQENEPTPNSANPYWRLCDGTDGTPDLRGRSTMGAGAGAGLTARANGDILGTEEVTLDLTQTPSHKHIVGSELGLSRTTDERLAGAAPGVQSQATPTTFGAYTSNAGGDPADSYNTAPHANISPMYCTWKIIKTARTR